MNRALLRSLWWKEWRLNFAVWLAMPLFMAAVYIGFAIMAAYYSEPFDVERFFAVALYLPSLYALACGASLFAGEHDSRTYDFQQSLPVSSKQIVAAKISFAAVSAFLLLPTQTLIALVLAGGAFPDVSKQPLLWWGSCVLVLQFLAHGVLWSLLVKRVLAATICFDETGSDC